MPIERWTIEGRIMEGYEQDDFELLWVVTSGPKPKHDGHEVEVVRADAYRGAVEALRMLADLHHRTSVDALHDPEHRDWTACDRQSCQLAQAIVGGQFETRLAADENCNDGETHGS